MDTRSAEIGQVIIDNENVEDDNAQEAPHNVIEENVDENNSSPEGEGGVEPMDQGAPNPATPIASSSTELFDMAPRASSKRQAEDDDMEDVSPDKRLRPRCPDRIEQMLLPMGLTTGL